MTGIITFLVLILTGFCAMLWYLHREDMLS